MNAFFDELEKDQLLQKFINRDINKITQEDIIKYLCQIASDEQERTMNRIYQHTTSVYNLEKENMKLKSQIKWLEEKISLLNK